MQILPRAWSPIWAVAGIIAGLMTLEIIEEPDMTLGQILMELAEPVLIVLAVAGVVHLLGRMQRQHREQLSLMRDLEVARAEGAQWRADMRELLKGLGSAIDAQFDRWQLTAAEREIALLMLKGLSHKEIARARDTSERTIRQQAQAIYGKANLSGRAALSAFFLEDLLLPREQSG
ncbi:MAG: LuxR C-terminal-related transcriptional regulator [Pseudomonadota bacterium]|nr:LuxR C-terminal-related transcriptional regulator [Pseudomonadota bacterium]